MSVDYQCVESALMAFIQVRSTFVDMYIYRSTYIRPITSIEPPRSLMSYFYRNGYYPGKRISNTCTIAIAITSVGDVKPSINVYNLGICAHEEPITCRIEFE